MAQALKLSDVLTNDELRALQQKSNVKALITLLWTWVLIGCAFALAIIWPNPLTIVAGIVLIGGRQLGLGIINHDCSHYAFFKRKAVDDFVGHWLCGAPINVSLYAYRDYHAKHHRYAGTPNDPDIGFVKNYPVSRDSLKRKFLRDLTGRTGFRDLLMKLKRFRFAQNYPWVFFHAGLLAFLTASGSPWAYLMWWAAELFVYPAIVRLRQIGEHGTALDRTSLDPRLNTGTTIAPWWQKVIVAPNNVNFHLEHHLASGIPPYNLSKMHKLLKSRGFYEGFDCISVGYINVLRRAVLQDYQNPVSA